MKKYFSNFIKSDVITTSLMVSITSVLFTFLFFYNINVEGIQDTWRFTVIYTFTSFISFIVGMSIVYDIRCKDTISLTKKDIIGQSFVSSLIPMLVLIIINMISHRYESTSYKGGFMFWIILMVVIFTVMMFTLSYELYKLDCEKIYR